MRGIAASISLVLSFALGCADLPVLAAEREEVTVTGRFHYIVGLSINSDETFDNGSVSFPFVGATANAMVDIYLDAAVTLSTDRSGQIHYQSGPVAGTNSAYAYTEATADGRHFNALQWAQVSVTAKTYGLNGIVEPSARVKNNHMDIRTFSEMNKVWIVDYGDDEEYWTVDWCEISEKWLISATFEFDLPDGSIEYDANGGEGWMRGQPLLYGESFTVLDNGFWRPGFRFTGWNSLADGSGAAYPVGARAYSTGRLRLFAQWAPREDARSYRIVYDGNGGTHAPPAQTAFYNQTVRLSQSAPVRAGYCFTGWNTRPLGDGRAYEPGTAVRNLAADGNTEVWLYAQWRKQGFRIIKAASNRYGESLIRRTPNDALWFERYGKLSVRQLMQLSAEDCCQIWRISRDGCIERIQ